MRIAVCIKQVAGGGAALDSGGILQRSAADSVLNPYDVYAIEAALQLSDEVTAFSMGPASAGKALREALAMGVGEACLLSDPAFAGADVYATAHTIAAGIRVYGAFDCVICGQQTTDGDTAQLPYALGVQLGYPTVGWVTALSNKGENLQLTQELTGSVQVLELSPPLVLAISPDAVSPRQVTLKNRLHAQKQEIRRLTLADLPDKDPAHYGLTGSPTRVKRVFQPELTRRAEPIYASAEEGAAIVLRELREGERHG